MMPLIDIHTHLKQPPPDGVIALNSVMAGEKPAQGKGVFNSLGIHPWQLIQQDEKQLEKLFFNSLETGNWAAIGEAGLDRAIDVPFDLQQRLFKMQAEVAAALNLPLLIHAVRSYPDLIQIRKQLPGNVNWIVHGFAGNMQSANELLRHEMYLSMGPSIMRDGHGAAELIQLIPEEKLFLESDNSGIDILHIYAKAARLRGTDLPQLQALIEINWHRVWDRNQPPVDFAENFEAGIG